MMLFPLIWSCFPLPMSNTGAPIACKPDQNVLTNVLFKMVSLTMGFRIAKAKPWLSNIQSLFEQFCYSNLVSNSSFLIDTDMLISAWSVHDSLLHKEVGQACLIVSKMHHTLCIRI